MPSQSVLENTPGAETPATVAAVSTPAQIEARRAQQLLERAQGLAERGDMAAAILAARQSLALAPANAGGHAVLGELLERANDYAGATNAYEKSLQLAPQNSTVAGELTRLRARLEQSQGAARQFQFNEAELYPGAETGETPRAPETRAAAPVAEQIVVAPNATTPNASAPTVVAPEFSEDEQDDFLDIDPDSALSLAPAEAPAEASAATATEASEPESALLMANIEARLPPSRAEMEALEAATDQANETAPVQTTVIAPATKPAAPATEALNPFDQALAAPAAEMANGATGNGMAGNGATGNGASKGAATRRSSPAPLRPMALTFDDAGLPVPLQPVVPSSRRVAERRQTNVPVGTNRRQTPDRRTNVAAPVVAAPGLAGADVAVARAASAPQIAPAVAAGARAPIALNLPAPAPVAPLPMWRQVANRPSFYARTLPLVGVALLGLGFLGWARSRAVAQFVAPVAPIAVADAPATTVSDPGAATANPASAEPVLAPVVPDVAAGTGAGNREGFPISSATAPPANPTEVTASTGTPAQPATGNRNPSARPAPPRTATRPATRALPRPAPNFPNVLAPAPIPPQAVQTGGTNPSGGGGAGGAGGGVPGGGTDLVLPRPQINLPAPDAPPASVLPPDKGLNPAGASDRGFVRVQGGVGTNGVVPAQPAGVARQSEQNASAAARQGQTDEAINQLSQAIRADADNAGFRYQQRAALFLQRGDNARARDDFQSAISAYQGQIARGENVAAARRGIQSARSGLNVALSASR